jgi:hypothetical protein
MVYVGTSHEHISRLKGYDDASGQTYDGTREEWYSYVQSGSAYVQDSVGHRAQLYGRTSIIGNNYVQTQRDGYWSDNLLALPMF